MFYSKSASGFFDIDHPAIPEDAVEISDDLYFKLLEGQSNGKVIVGDKDGVPYLADPPPPSIDELKSIALARKDNLMSLAAIRIAPLQDAVDLDEATESEVASLKAWKKYRVALNRIQEQEGFPANIDWPVAPD